MPLLLVCALFLFGFCLVRPPLFLIYKAYVSHVFTTTYSILNK